MFPLLLLVIAVVGGASFPFWKSEEKPDPIKVTTLNNGALVRVSMTTPGKPKEIPYKVTIKDENDNVLLEAYNSNSFQLSSTHNRRFESEIHATIEDRKGNKTVLERIHLEIKKRPLLTDLTQQKLDELFNLLKRRGKIVLSLVGGCGEGKSSLFKAIYNLLMDEGFKLREGDEKEITCHNSKKSVTTSVYSYAMTKIIDQVEVEIEIIDSPGIWESSTINETNVPEQMGKLISDMLNGKLRNGMGLYPNVDTSKLEKQVSKSDVVLCCFKHCNLTSSGIGRTRFNNLKDFVYKTCNRSCLLVTTWYDEVLNKNENPNCLNFEFDGDQFVRPDSDPDYLFSNYLEPISNLEELGVDFLPIINKSTTNLSATESQSRKDLMKYLLAQLLVYSIKLKDASL